MKKPNDVVIYFDTKGEPSSALVLRAHPLDGNELDLIVIGDNGLVETKYAVRHGSERTEGHLHCWEEFVDKTGRIHQRLIDSLPVAMFETGSSATVPLTEAETKQYADGSSATGPGPLPDLSPHQQQYKEDLIKSADHTLSAEEVEDIHQRAACAQVVPVTHVAFNAELGPRSVLDPDEQKAKVAALIAEAEAKDEKLAANNAQMREQGMSEEQIAEATRQYMGQGQSNS